MSDEHPNPQRFWTWLRRIMQVGVFVILAVLVVATWAWLVFDIEGAVELLKGCLWGGVFLVAVYAVRDGAQSWIEKWGGPKP